MTTVLAVTPSSMRAFIAVITPCLCGLSFQKLGHIGQSPVFQDKLLEEPMKMSKQIKCRMELYH
jgi:hypothetical protein